MTHVVGGEVPRYFRTYIFTFVTDSGVGYYAGKRKSRHRIASDDPYVGSGVYPKRAIEKYGHCCIVSKVWFDHDTEQSMDMHEKAIIRCLKDECGRMCKNIANGGDGGDTLKYATPERRKIALDNRSKSQLVAQNNKSTQLKRIDSLKKKFRTSEHWNFIDELFLLWTSSDRPTSYSFRGIAIKHGFPDCNYLAMVKEFCAMSGTKPTRKSTLTSPVWEYRDELYLMWINNGKCGHAAMRKHAVSCGYPDVKYSTMIDKFRKIETYEDLRSL